METTPLAPLVDTHVHSDTSHTPESILRVANLYDVVAFKGKTVEQVQAEIQAPEGANWDTWYAHMIKTRQAYVSPEAIGALIEDILEDASAHGVDVIELRISLLSTVQALIANLSIKDPQAYFRYAQLVFEKIIEATQKKRSKIATDLVISISSQEKYQQYLADLMQFCRDYKDHIAALDITYEKGLSPSHFAAPIEAVRSDIQFLTIHSMEVMGPERGWEALKLDPDRIGHGIRAIEDPKLMEELRRRNIPLEMCVRSNLITGTAKKDDHPIKKLFNAGIPLTIGSDGCNDGSTLKDNYEMIRRDFGFSEDELRKLRQNSWDFSFRQLRNARFGA